MSARKNDSDPLEPWTVPESDYPVSGETWEQLSFCLNYAVLAPSSHNTQPWRFKLDLEHVRLYADRTRALPLVDPYDREWIMSCGAALCHLQLAIRYFGRTDEVTLFPEPNDPDLLAIVRLGRPYLPAANEKAMFQAIPRRHTNRQPFENRSLPESLLDSLRRAAADADTALLIFTDDPRRQQIAQFVWHGDRAQMTSPSFRRELASWIHPSRSVTRDGIPAYAYGLGELLDFATPLFSSAMRTFDLGKGIAAHDARLVEGSPVLAILCTETDTASAWLSAGQALARLLLLACAHGVSGSFLNQPLEVHTLRSQFREALRIGGFPQILLRLGYGPPTQPTPRRDVRQVLI
jgi:nitroreductase